jgi:CubicO group peptidase (beta-lactamase class C family)
MTRFSVGRRRFNALLGSACAALMQPVSAVNATRASEESPVTTDRERLKGIAVQAAALLQQHIASGYMPGGIALITHGDDVQVVLVGRHSREIAGALRRNALFRISSMTKPVTAAAAMMLIEDGKLRLDAAIDYWLPELARRRVLKRIDSELYDTVPARRPITVADLLTSRLGWGIVLAPPDTYPIQKQIAALKLVGFGAPDPASPIGPDEWLKRLGTLPLMAQPGEQWMYNTGAYVLGVLLARASGRSLPDLLHTRIFEPLGMADTGFFVTPDKRDRLVSAYRLESGTLVLYDGPANSAWATPPAFPDGGAGLVSTADDFLAFSQLLVHRGRANGRRLLTEASITAMTTNQLSAAQRDGGAAILGRGRGWGVGMSVVVAPSDEGLPDGAYGWNGGLGTSWIADPNSRMTALLMTQTMFTSPTPPAVHQELWRAVFSPTVL